VFDATLMECEVLVASRTNADVAGTCHTMSDLLLKSQFVTESATERVPSALTVHSNVLDGMIDQGRACQAL